MKTNNDNKTVVPSHIEDERLIAFLDGEVETDFHRGMQAHLESCWDCRSRLSNVERSIENFLLLRQNELLPPELPPSGPALELFTARLTAHRALAPSHSFFKIKFPDFRALSLRVTSSLNVASYSLRSQVLIARATAAILVISVITVFVLLSGRFNTVSASELLRRSIDAQGQQLNEITQPVIHQRIQVKRGSKDDKPLTWEIWNDTTNSRVKTDTLSEPVAIGARDLVRTGNGSDRVLLDSTVQDLRSILIANRMNEHRPLSAASYKSWSDSLYSKTEEVTTGTNTNGTEILTIKTTPTISVSDGRIIEARFAVRAGDYHPIELNIKTKTADSEQEFDLVEQDFAVVSLKDVDPSVFADPTKIETASTVGTKSEPGTVVTGSPETADANTTAGLPVPNVHATTADEVEVLDRLHQIGADISEQLTVTRTADGRLLVEGLVETDKRKSEILRALAPVSNNPALRIKVQTIEEATRALQKQKQQTLPGTIDRVEVEKGALPVDSDLREYFAKNGGDTDEQIRRFASRILGHSQSALFQASALNRMANRFNADQLRTLDPAARTKWLNILKGYAAVVRRETAALRGELQPIFGGMAEANGESVTSDSDLIASARRLYELASANDRVIRSAFTISSGGMSVSAVKTAQFRRSLGSAESLAAAIERAR
jgi:hypothetical protein